MNIFLQNQNYLNDFFLCSVVKQYGVLWTLTFENWEPSILLCCCFLSRPAATEPGILSSLARMVLPLFVMKQNVLSTDCYTFASVQFDSIYFVPETHILAIQLPRVEQSQ
jgi:hypothetical protein